MIWYFRIAFAAIAIGLLVRAFLERNPTFRPEIPPWVVPSLSAGLVGIAGFLLYVVFFTPKPDIQISGFRFGFLPVNGKYRIVGSAAFVNNGQATARDVSEAKYVFKRPEKECATKPLSSAEVQQYADEAHRIFLKEHITHTERIADLVPITSAVPPIINSGEDLTEDQRQQFLDGKCVLFFVGRIRYAGNHVTDYFRYAHGAAVGKIERYERRR